MQAGGLGIFRRIIIVAALFGGLLLPLIACAASEKEVVGTVVVVEERSLTELSSLTVRDEFGKEWTFVAEGFVGMTPTHLVQHQATQEKVRVTYVKRDDGALVVLNMQDG